MTAGGRFAVVLSAHKRVLDYNGITEHGEKKGENNYCFYNIIW